jgi:hypothetical protein
LDLPISTDELGHGFLVFFPTPQLLFDGEVAAKFPGSVPAGFTRLEFGGDFFGQPWLAIGNLIDLMSDARPHLSGQRAVSRWQAGLPSTFNKEGKHL